MKCTLDTKSQWSDQYGGGGSGDVREEWKGGGRRGGVRRPPHGADMCNDDPCGVTSHSIAAPQLASTSVSLADAFSPDIYFLFELFFSFSFTFTLCFVHVIRPTYLILVYHLHIFFSRYLIYEYMAFINRSSKLYLVTDLISWLNTFLQHASPLK